MSIVLVLVAVGGFVAMEGISYSTHRWVMHGVGMRWHRSHHLPPAVRWFEQNDVFPVLFSFIGFGVFLCASLTSTAWLYWLGGGVAAYGLLYVFVHDVYIHRRLPCPIDNQRTLDWLRDSHEIHHLYGGEPFGMLLPVVGAEVRRRAATQRRLSAGSDPAPPRRDRIRRTRTRL
jgi:beta-carotene 3-hydroxylase